MEITCYDKYGRVIENIVQWDVGQSISIKGYDLTSYAPQIHFANANSEKALVVESVLSGGLLSCQVPNSLARENLPIIMYIYDAVGETGKTNTIIKIPVTPRPMPDDVMYTDDVGVISLTEVLRQAREYMNNSLNYSTKAKESEEKAKTSADAAKVSETNAAKSESTASSSATQAAQSAKEAKAYVGSPLVANTVSAMTDQTKIYVYTGSESGYTAGNWYYHNGSAWVSGGVYNSSAVNVDKTLTQDGYAADAKVTGDAVTSLKEDFDDISKSEVPFVRFEKDFKNVFNRTEYDDGIVSKETTYSENTADSGNTAKAVSLWRGSYITGAVINTKNDFNVLEFPSNSNIGIGVLVAMLCKFDPDLIHKSGSDFKYKLLEEHTFAVDGTAKWVQVELNKTYASGKYIVLVRKDINSTANGTFFSGFALNGIYCSEYDDTSTKYGLISINKNGERALFDNSYGLPIFVQHHKKGNYYFVSSPIKNKKILFFGDSITAGEPSNGNFYVPRLIKKTGAILSANYAVWGATWHHTGDVDGNTSTNNTIPNQVYKMLSEKEAGTYSDTPDIVVFSAGTNDHTRNENGATIRNQFLSDSGGYLSIDDCNLNSYIGSIRWCYEKVQDAFPNAQIFLATPIQGNETTRFVEIIEYIADTIKAVSRRLSCCVIDAYEKSNIYGRYEVKNANGKCLRDGLHPNDYGSDLMAECYRLEIETQYKEID